MRFCPVCHERYDDAAQFCPRDGEPLPVDEADARIGTVLLGQFELVEVIGKGAMGTVYRAWQTGMERQVAIKILLPELMRDPKVVARFDREARAVAKLAHPNIVTSFLVGDTDDGLPFMAMELVDGESLADVLEREGKLDRSRALHIALQIAAALTEAHAEGIVHRDLKPANILLTQRRRMPDFVKVLDFGIAKILSGDAESREEMESRLTREGTVFGTPHYIAPEQAAGSDVDHRADLYSLGCILFRMLTGQVPFDGAGMAVLLAHIGQPPPRARDVAPEIDPALDALIARALEKDPAARFQSAEEMADALERAGAARPATEPAADVSPPELPVSSRDFEIELVEAPRPSSKIEVLETRRPSSKKVAISSPTPASQSRPAGESIGPLVPARRRGGPWLALLGLVAAGGVAAGAVVLYDRRREPPLPPPVVAVAPEPTPPPAVVEPPPTALPAVVEPSAAPSIPLRTVTVGEAGFAIRAQVPREPKIGGVYPLTFDVIAPDGKPLGLPAIEASFEDPKDQITKVGAPAVTGTPGRYALERRFDAAGRQHVHILPAPDQPSLHIWFDLLVTDAEGKVPEEPVARPPKGKRRTPLASRGIQMLAPEPPPKPLAEPAGGDGASDPYHDDLVEEEPLKEPPPPPPTTTTTTPPTPPPQSTLHRRERNKPKTPNPDGLE